MGFTTAQLYVALLPTGCALPSKTALQRWLLGAYILFLILPTRPLLYLQALGRQCAQGRALRIAGA